MSRHTSPRRRWQGLAFLSSTAAGVLPIGEPALVAVLRKALTTAAGTYVNR